MRTGFPAFVPPAAGLPVFPSGISLNYLVSGVENILFIPSINCIFSASDRRASGWAMRNRNGSISPSLISLHIFLGFSALRAPLCQSEKFKLVHIMITITVIIANQTRSSGFIISRFHPETPDEKLLVSDLESGDFLTRRIYVAKKLDWKRCRQGNNGKTG